MAGQDNSTRLAKLEANFEFIKDLLKEIRDDVKSMPVKEDYDRLEYKITHLENRYTSLAIKVGAASAVLGVLGGSIIKMILG